MQSSKVTQVGVCLERAVTCDSPVLIQKQRIDGSAIQ